jgi:hypothetical protein
VVPKTASNQEASMSKRHLFLFDILMPIAAIFGVGKFLSTLFDTSVFLTLDRVKAFGFGMMFSHSPFRNVLWDYSWVMFAAAPALLWLIWVRINVEYDYVSRSRRLDRPLYGFFKGLLKWIDGDDGLRWQIQSLEFRAAQSEERARKLEAELMRTRQEVGDLEQANQDLEDELQNIYEPNDAQAIQ